MDGTVCDTCFPCLAASSFGVEMHTLSFFIYIYLSIYLLYL